MRNGKYELVVAPKDYPYKKYRGRYCYEHILIWWRHNGEIPKGHEIHHKNENTRDNRIENLECLSSYAHKEEHGKGVTMVVLVCPGCDKQFKKRKGQTHLGGKGGDYTACSRKCSGKVSLLPREEVKAKNIKISEIVEKRTRAPWT